MCIRDRYQRRVRGTAASHMLVALVLLAVVVLASVALAIHQRRPYDDAHDLKVQPFIHSSSCEKPEDQEITIQIPDPNPPDPNPDPIQSARPWRPARRLGPGGRGRARWPGEGSRSPGVRVAKGPADDVELNFGARRAGQGIKAPRCKHVCVSNNI
eukprot:TRINITY_DN59903_c0_g1_i1.p1 TRINITY_DN59903_c0_g1~~TRINITY_DN59903_c0_g1_i1.p1  ORF type:complete len:156 (-),score=21.73 TRINITY_DN59903_c0_g1_i1:244-711(-)